MDAPVHENPQYRWHVQCYHYETRHRTRTDKDGRTVHYTETVCAARAERGEPWRSSA